MKKRWIKFGFAALSAIITAAVTACVSILTNKSKTKNQAQAAMELEDHKLENAMDLEEKRTEERRKRLRDEEEHQRRMWEMREEQRQKRSESSQQPTTDQAFEVPYVSKVAPFKESLENDTRELEWLVGKKIEVGGRCLIYGPAGVGKSAFALQTAIHIAGGTEYGFLPSEEENQHEAQQVILIDLEMSAAEQKERTRGITIPDNLLRNTEPIYNLDELFRMIEHESHGPKVTVIIDNIRKLEEEMSQTNQVNEYFSKLEKTQEKLAAKGIIVTFITITHTGKDFDMYKPVQLSDIAGGADLARFSTSVYALVPGRDGNVVFKALKQRNTARMEDVHVLRIKESPNLHLDFVCTCKEGDALPVKPKGGKASNTSKSTADAPKKKGNTKLTETDVDEIIARINDGESIDNLAVEYGVNPITIQRRMEAKTKVTDSQEDTDQAA
ncbi:MAG: AAA family ATPase [Muribaculaceae bacterium]|nr:AAA family ATPase [Muribaculaceae bacterium]